MTEPASERFAARAPMTLSGLCFPNPNRPFQQLYFQQQLLKAFITYLKIKQLFSEGDLCSSSIAGFFAKAKSIIISVCSLLSQESVT